MEKIKFIFLFCLAMVFFSGCNFMPYAKMPTHVHAKPVPIAASKGHTKTAPIVSSKGPDTPRHHKAYKNPVKTHKSYAKARSHKTSWKKIYGLRKFDNVIIKGKAKVIINSGKRPAVTRCASKYRCKFRGHSLYISVPRYARAYRTIKITVPVLKDLVVKDGAHVKAKNLAVMNLFVETDNETSTILQGQIFAVCTKITQKCGGRIKIAWLDSDKVIVNSQGHGWLWLAGKTRNLSAKLACYAYLDSKYLRADKALIITEDKARADVLPLQYIYAFAKDKSLITYYQIPKHADIFSKDSGNVFLASDCRFKDTPNAFRQSPLGMGK